MVCSSPDYYTVPPLDELDSLVEEGGVCEVEGFTVGRTGYGEVHFPGNTNVYGLNIDQLGECIVRCLYQICLAAHNFSLEGAMKLKTKGYSPGVFFQGPKKCVEKSNPSESKRKEKLNGACFSCIAHVSREL